MLLSGQQQAQEQQGEHNADQHDCGDQGLGPGGRPAALRLHAQLPLQGKGAMCRLGRSWEAVGSGELCLWLSCKLTAPCTRQTQAHGSCMRARMQPHVSSAHAPVHAHGVAGRQLHVVALRVVQPVRGHGPCGICLPALVPGVLLGRRDDVARDGIEPGSRTLVPQAPPGGAVQRSTDNLSSWPCSTAPVARRCPALRAGACSGPQAKAPIPMDPHLYSRLVSACSPVLSRRTSRFRSVTTEPGHMHGGRKGRGHVNEQDLQGQVGHHRAGASHMRCTRIAFQVGVRGGRPCAQGDAHTHAHARTCSSFRMHMPRPRSPPHQATCAHFHIHALTPTHPRTGSLGCRSPGLGKHSARTCHSPSSRGGPCSGAGTPGKCPGAMFEVALS